MKNTFLITLLLILSISCNQKTENSSSDPIETSSEYVDISVVDFNSAYAEPDSNTVILDVRTDQEYEAGNIPNSILIDFMSPDFKSKVSKLDPNKTYVVYCRTGRRSTSASKIMTQELGFKDVKNLEGGYVSWSKSE